MVDSNVMTMRTDNEHTIVNLYEGGVDDIEVSDVKIVKKK